MKYDVIFDSTRTQADWWLWYSPILFVSLLMIVVVILVIWGVWRGARRISLVGIGLLLLLGVKVSFDYLRYHRRYGNYRHYTGPYQVVEGNVKNYRAFSGKEAQFEQFQVSGMEFSYADMGPPRCFHKPATRGGPIHEGLVVRVSFDAGCIVKLEVEKASL